jgi:transposase
MPRVSLASNYEEAAKYQRRLIVDLVQEDLSYGKYSRVEKELNIHRAKVRYWWKKYNEIDFHNLPHGGPKNQVFKPWEIDTVCSYVIYFFDAVNRNAKVKELQEALSTAFDRTVRKSTTKKLLSSMGWSWKVPVEFQLNKFSNDNIARYLLYLDWAKSKDPTKFKYCDESHVVPRQLGKGKQWGLKSKRIYTRNTLLHQKSSSISIITSLDPLTAPVYLGYREESNSAWDFFDFISNAVESGFFEDGDFLIVDNASVHHEHESAELLQQLLRAHGVEIIYLPAYSPELNPCELVFSQIKRYIRNNTGNESIIQKIVDALGGVTPELLLNFYKKCVFPKVILPEIEFK